MRLAYSLSVHCRIIRLEKGLALALVDRLMEHRSASAVHRLMEERSELVFRCLNS